MIYIVTFFSSVIMIYFSERTKNKLLNKILVCLALFLPCILAALRNNKIGTDVNVYVKKMYDAALTSQKYFDYLNKRWWMLYKYNVVSDYEPAFRALVYCVTKLTNNINFVLFVIELLIITPIYCGLSKLKELKGYKYYAVMVFYFTMYNMGYNVMRQMIAVSIVFCGSCNLLSKNEKYKNIKFFIFLIVGMMFHTSAVSGILIWLIYRIYNLDENKKDIKIKINDYSISLRKIELILISLIFIFIIGNLQLVMKILSILGFTEYSVYVKNTVTFLVSKIIREIPIIIMIFMFRKQFFSNYDNAYFYVTIFIISMVIAQFASASQYGERISYIFQIFKIILIPLLINCLKGKRKIYWNFGMDIYLILYWIYYYVILNIGETYPYIAFWQ